MGAINLKHTGSGADVTLSSDGTNLLLGGTAIGGGGGADLYAVETTGSINPTASGTLSIAIGSGAVASGTSSVSIAKNTDATGSSSTAVGIGAQATADYATAFGASAQATVTTATAIGYLSASSQQGAISLGRSRASGVDSFASAIITNTSSYGAIGHYSVAMSRNAKASGYGGTAIGWYTQATGSDSFAVGYYSESTANDAYSFGKYAKSATKGKLAYASGQFAATGDAQGGQFILRADTTDATATVLTTDNGTAGSTNQIVAASDTCITFDGTITAMQNGAQAYASWKIEGLLVNDGGTTTLANSATTVIQNLSSWGMALSADNTNNALAITCTGEAAHNIRWVANIRTTEVTYA